MPIVTTATRNDFSSLRNTIHRKLIQRLNLERLTQADREVVRREVAQLIEGIVIEDATPMTFQERERLCQEVMDEVFGLGPLEPLLKDPTISDILVNNYKTVFIERNGLLERSAVQFRDDDHLRQIVDRIVSAVGRRVDESSPMVDARLPDGSRVNAIIPPLALDGPCVSIRRFGRDPLVAEDLLRNNTFTLPMLELLRACVRARLNILISGGTGSGKTTLLNVLSSFISDRERIVTIEDAAELQLKQTHVVRLETRPPNVEGKGAVRQRQLVINSLRMRPDRIVVGEVRGDEALDMLQAMNTGHDGSLTTIHANSPRDALSRLETMVAMANLGIPESATRRQIASAIDVVVQLSRLSDGTRKLLNITEITGMEADVISMQDVFVFKRMGIGPNGEVLGEFTPTGIRPKFSERLVASGIRLSAEMFSSKNSR
jgi:pilus assembly protein CpaF